MKKNGNKACFLVLFMALMVANCATSPEGNKMIPHVDFSTFAPSSRTIKVSEVKGGEETAWDLSKIDNKSFGKALVETIRKSGLFKQIYIDRAGDYELYTEILSQKLQPGLTAFAALYIRYRLVETGTNQVLWRESIFSQNDAFGSNQGKDVLEGAARDNLAQLIRKLADIVSQQERN